MIDPRQVAMRLLGSIDWQTEVSGYCKCPGESFHTSHNGKKDCRVNLDGAPTIFCFHSSCIAAVSETNRRLRRELGASPWQIILPSGNLLRSGDVLQKTGDVLPREVIHASARARGQAAGERLVLESIRVTAER